MYNHLRGTLTHKEPTRIVIEVGGVGYDIQVPLSVSQASPAVGSEIILLTHLVVKEDNLRLIGFLDEDSRRLFRILIAISGVGPSLAMQIVSSATPQDFALAVERQDSSFLKKIKGIGEKTAKRIILELKGAKTVLVADDSKAGVSPGIATDAVTALEAMGVSQHEAVDRVQRALAEDAGLSLENLIRKALP